MKEKTLSIGPLRIPREYREGLEQLLKRRVHLTMSDLVREGIFLLLVKEGIIDEKQTNT